MPMLPDTGRRAAAMLCDEELLDEVAESRACSDCGVFPLFEQMPDLPMEAAS
jgi:hypothetical protein